MKKLDYLASENLGTEYIYINQGVVTVIIPYKGKTILRSHSFSTWTTTGLKH